MIAGVELWTEGHTVPLLQMPLLPCRRFFSGAFAANDRRRGKSVNNHRPATSYGQAVQRASLKIISVYPRPSVVNVSDRKLLNCKP